MKNKPLFIAILFTLIGFSIKAQVPHFWGMTTEYSSQFASTIYQINADGTGYQQVVIIYPDWQVYGKLVKGPDDNFYGLAYGGQGSGGGLFKINPLTNVFTDICNFPQLNIYSPCGNVTVANNGKLYGTVSMGDSSTMDGGIFCYDINTNQTTVVHGFDTSNYLFGASPSGSFLLANNGLLYGINGWGANGFGVIFSFDPSTNIYSDLYNMDSINGTIYNNLMMHSNSLIQANNGLLYGMTSGGGASNKGVIFSFDISTNIYTKLVDFTGSNGATPLGTPFEVNDSLLYGLTYVGGTDNAGVIFLYNINSNSYNVVHNFDTLTGNINPRGSLIQASDGNLYGTTGNPNNYDTIGNSIFQFNPVSNIYTDIFNFNVNITGFGPGDLMESPLTSGILALNHKDEITVYPNPTSSIFTLTYNSKLISCTCGTQLIITDVMGRTVYTLPVTDLNQTTINISQLSNGVYLYQLTNSKESFRGKFVKE